MSSVSTFGIGFIARPLGAILIGTYADKVGRKPAMILTMLLMAIGTAGLILLPGYEQIGIAAPILLVIARLAQGLAWGGEAGPATTFIMEAAPEGKRAFYASWQIVAQGGAAITAGLVGYILSLYLTHQQQTDWGWRIAFGLGLCILPIAILMRRHLGETLKLEDKAENNSTKGLLKEIFEHHSALIFIGIFVLSGSTVTQYGCCYFCVGWRLLCRPVWTTDNNRYSPHHIACDPLARTLSRQPIQQYLGFLRRHHNFYRPAEH